MKKSSEKTGSNAKYARLVNIFICCAGIRVVMNSFAFVTCSKSGFINPA